MRFIKKNGRIIPIAEDGDHKGTVASIASKGRKHGTFKDENGKTFRLIKAKGEAKPGLFGGHYQAFAKTRVVGKVYN